MLMLLMLVACTEETAEVDTLSRQQLMVDMQVSGMKATTRAGEEETINTVTALVFRNDVLTSVEKMVKLANSNNFVMNLPQSNDVIHFLANLPDDVVLPTQMEGSQQSVLTALYTEIEEELSYWGMATYYGDNQLDNVLLYRNMAMITIEPAAEDAVFTQEQLKIAGLVNANTRGMLVPYKDAFNFDMGNIGETDYLTLPDKPNPQTVSYVQQPVTSTYVFEHDNPDTSEGLYVICKIDDYYYKVALADEDLHPYDIIRNHKYIIRIADVCDVPDNQRSTDYSTVVNNCAPINMEVQEIKNVTLSLSHSVNPFNYSEFAHEAFTVTVGNVRGVERLTFTAPECFDIASGYATLENGEYVIADTNRDQINFTFKLKDGMTPDEQLTIGVDGSGTYVNVTETQIQLNTASYQGNDMVLWMGSVILDVNDDRTKIPIPYSLFQDGTIEAGDQIQIYFEDAGDGWIQAASPTEGNNWNHLPSFNGGNGSPNTFTLTTGDIEQINSDHRKVWGWNEIDAAFFIQGLGRKLTKVVLIPAKPQITADTPTPTSLYYNSSTEQTVTVNVTIPSGVTALNIKADDFSSVKQGDTSLEKPNDVYVYTRAAEKVATEETIPFVLTLNGDKFSQQQYDTSTNIIFSDGSDNPNVTGDTVVINVKKTPVQGAEQELWGSGEGEGSYTFSNNDSWTLLGANGSGGTLASYKELFKAGATLKVAFTTTSEGYPLELFTNWSRNREFVEEYSYDKDSKYLIYKFVDDDFGGPGGTNDVTNAGLILAVIGNVTVTITKISIKPAPTP